MSEAEDYLADVPDRIKPALLAAHADKVLKGRAGAEMLLERFVAGKSIPRIADELGISHVAAYQHLLRHVPNEWKEHQGAKALAVLDKCEEDLEGATDNVTVSRAREYARLQMWKLERTLRNLYAPDNTTININQVIGDPSQIIQEIRQLEERLGLVDKPVDNSLTISETPNNINK